MSSELERWVAVAPPLSSHGWSRLLLPFLLPLAALLLYLLHLDRAPHPDELYHILAARGLLETGEPRIGEGLYPRGFLFTWLVAQSFRLFGEGLATARLPSVLATSLLILVLFVWVRREAGDLAAWLAAGFYAISPFAVLIAQFCRFYALQTLAFILALWLVHDFFRTLASWPRALLRLLLAAALVVLATLLQPTTLLGLLALASWVAPILLWRLATPLSHRGRILLLAVVAVAAMVLLATAWALGLIATLWQQYRAVPVFNAETRDAFWFYHFWYVLLYPTLWPATGLLALLAWIRSPWLGSLATVVFAIAFLLNSFAGPKSLRYIAYAQPLLFVIWGIGLAALFPALRAWTAELRRAMTGTFAFLNQQAARLASFVVACALGVLVAVNPFWLRTATVIADIPVPPEKPSTDWRLAASALAPWIARVDVVVATEELAPLYFLGRADIVHSRSKLNELPATERRDFGRDPRTGRPVIGSLEALERVLDCYSSGLMLAPAYHLGVPHQLGPEVLALLATRAERLSLPERAHALAWIWQHAQPKLDPSRCTDLPEFQP